MRDKRTPKDVCGEAIDLGDYHALLLTLIVVLLKRGEYLHRMDEFIQGRQDF